MPSTILVKDFLFRVSTQLLDLSPQFERWGEVELVDALNDGQRVIAKLLPHTCSRVDAMKLAPGTRQSIALVRAANIIPGDGSAAVDTYGQMLLGVHRNLGTDGATPGNTLRIVDRDVLDATQPDWHTKSGAPREYTYDPRTPKVFYVSPGVPAAGNTWVEVSFVADPAPVPNTGGLFAKSGNSTIKLSIDDRNVDDLFYYVMARANLKEAEYGGNANLAASYTQMFINSMNGQVAAVTGVNPNLKNLPMNPGAPASAS